MLAAAVLSALLFGIAPAIQATRSNVMQAARGEFTTDFRPARLRNALVVGQVTVSVLLLICAAVLIRVNHRMQQLDVGLQTRGVARDESAGPLSRKSHFINSATDPGVQTHRGSQQIPFDGYLPRVPVVAGQGSAQVPGGIPLRLSRVFPGLPPPDSSRPEFHAGGSGCQGAAVAIVSQATAVAAMAGPRRGGTVAAYPAESATAAQPGGSQGGTAGIRFRARGWDCA